jgi:UDP-N-acetylglucosamine 1-carboxyvinyltransferase
MQGFQVRSDGPLSHPLHGTAHVGGAKNSALKLMAAALLAPGRTELANVPDILDVHVMARLLEELGCAVKVSHPGFSSGASSPSTGSGGSGSGGVSIEVPERLRHEAPYDLVRRLRASICVLGPLVARCGRAKVALPGGDNIGSRGLDMHFTGLTELGACVRIEHGFVVADVPDRLRGANLWLDFPSVGATENLLMAAVLAEGITTIDNVAREPEIVDLCEMLMAMGARIAGVGTSTLEIEGVETLHPAHHDVLPDRIVAGTFAFAAAMTGGDVIVRGARTEHLELALDKLVQAGATVSSVDDGFRVRIDGRPRAVDFVTLPYPGFPTDLQPMAIALNAVADGVAFVTENIFEGRFMFIDELLRLGADVRTDGHHAIVRGRERLSGAPVRATDIRAGAALVLAGMVADGVTTISDVQHVDRGYEKFVESLQALGARIERRDDATLV